MLYLLLDFIIDDESESSEKILKIGYSEKRFCASRKKEYDTHNYGYRLIQEIDFYQDYISVLGERPNYDVKFNTGRLKIDQLALEAYKKEVSKHNKCK